MTSTGRSAHPPRGLGAFLGVFTPTVLTILGVILYLRMGWVVGQMGLSRTLVIVGLANVITLITTLAFSSVATNARVGVGGAYFLISRSLGLRIGGAIGLPLFLSQAFSVTLYAFGLAESVRFVWPAVPVAPVAALIICGVGALAFRGAGVALRAQIPILGLIGLSLVALIWGAVSSEPQATPFDASASSAGFWEAFAVFFPAVTGIMAGLGLSGDLEDPERAIPRGALAAQLVGFAVYLFVPVLLARGATAADLRSDPLIWAALAPLGAWLIFPGLWGAIFSSAVGSMLGAPRTLQALALDHLAPRRLGEVSARRREPLFGLAVTLAIALGAVLLGDLNRVATVVSLFFLTVYGTLNLAAALEGLANDPYWRPRLRVPWPVPLAGALACFGVMLLVSPLATGLAILVEASLWLLLQRRERQADWGDVRRGFYEATIRWALMQLARRPATPRSWRPHVLVFTEKTESELELVRFGDWFSQHRGVVTVCELLAGDLFTPPPALAEREQELRDFLQRHGLVAFAEAQLVRTREDGMLSVAQANGIAGLESNTLVVSWPEQPAELARLMSLLRPLGDLGKSVVIGRVRVFPPAVEHKHRLVRVWWGGRQRNIHFMLLLAHLLTRNPEWRGARIEVLSLVSNPMMSVDTVGFLERLREEIRIPATIRVIERDAQRSIHDQLRSESAGADVVLFGLDQPGAGDEEKYAARLRSLVEGLPCCFLIRNNSPLLGELVPPLL